MPNKKNRITGINERADSNLFEEHDPLICNESLRSEVRIFRAVDVLSRIINGCDLSFNEFVDTVGKLAHYYENIAELQGIDVEELDILPPVSLEFDDFD